VTLVLAPASTASAGRNTSAVKVDNKTKAASLVLVESRVTSNGYSINPGWEGGGAPARDDTVAPHRSAHYELLTVPYKTIEGFVRFEIRDAGGKVLGEVTSTTIVDGESWFSYGSTGNRCTVTGNFTCLANDRDEVTVRDREYFEIGNRTTKLTFVMTDFRKDTEFGEGRPVIGTRLAPGEKLVNSLNPNFGRLSQIYFIFDAEDASGAKKGTVYFSVSVTPTGEHTTNCIQRVGDYKCYTDGKDRVLFLDLGAAPPKD